MAISIKNDRADQLARELAGLTGESLTDAVIGALEARLEAEQRSSRQARGLNDILERFDRLPLIDERHPDDILGYDQDGLPA